MYIFIFYKFDVFLSDNRANKIEENLFICPQQFTETNFLDLPLPSSVVFLFMFAQTKTATF